MEVCTSDLSRAALEAENVQLHARVAKLEALLEKNEYSFSALRLTPCQDRIFAGLMARDQATKEQLLTIAYADRVHRELPDIKIVDVFICKIRQKLKPFGITIETLWGRGYRVTPEAKKQVRLLCERASGGVPLQ